MTINYNKVKTEGLEEFDNKFIVIDRAGRKRFMTMNELSLADNIKSFLSTFAEKVHKATLEDVLEFLGEIDVPYFEPNDIHESGQIVGKNKERQRIRDYIKTLTK